MLNGRSFSDIGVWEIAWREGKGREAAMAETRSMALKTSRKKQALDDIESKGVKLCKMATTGKEDKAAIEQQLGFFPTNVHSVAARSQSGQA